MIAGSEGREWARPERRPSTREEVSAGLPSRQGPSELSSFGQEPGAFSNGSDTPVGEEVDFYSNSYLITLTGFTGKLQFALQTSDSTKMGDVVKVSGTKMNGFI